MSYPKGDHNLPSRACRSKKRRFAGNQHTNKTRDLIMTTRDSIVLEICVDNVESVRNAIDGGADRLELCSGLGEGGLTPSLGFAKLARLVSKIPVFAMLRLRGGNFVYLPEEIDAMLVDLRELKKAGVDGFVFGALTSENQLDEVSCAKIVKEASPLPVTFHRAFDEVADPLGTLDTICQLGFARILTSGQKKSALEGSDLIKKLIDRANGAIVVMPGAGITEKNVATIRDQTGAVEFHGSAKRSALGEIGIAHNALTVTDADIVRSMVDNLKGNL